MRIKNKKIVGNFTNIITPSYFISVNISIFDVKIYDNYRPNYDSLEPVGTNGTVNGHKDAWKFSRVLA